MLRAFSLLIVASLVSSVSSAAPRGAPSARRTDRPCGAIAAEGCCAGSTLYWCTAGRLVALDCASRPLCGWHARGRYDCSTAGHADPQGKHAKQCVWSRPPQPAANARRASACGAITGRGCCDGAKLKFCASGQLRVIDCSRNPSCGFRGVGQIYDCGTDGKGDPRARHAQRCPTHRASERPTPRRPHFVGSAQTPATPGAAAPSPPAKSPSSCQLAGANRRAPALDLAWLVALVIGVMLARSRRTSRRRRQPPDGSRARGT